MLQAIAAIIAAIAGVANAVIGSAAANLSSYRAISQNQIAYNQQKDLGAYQIANQQSKTTGIIVVAGFIFIVVLIAFAVFKRKK